MPESRRYNAEYYDLTTKQDADTKFYANLVTKDDIVLELGCGTGRVCLALASKVSAITAVDISETMLDRARSKDDARAVEFLHGDISKISLGKKFSFIIAPFRVMQALESDKQVEGLLDVVREHLSAEGTAILNVFCPLYPRDEMNAKWPRPGETAISEFTLADGDTLKVSDTRHTLDADRQVLHPEIIYRRYRCGQVVDEHINPICMRYYYADEFKCLIENAGFKITQTWGGYKGETYGEGPELVVAFQKA